MNIVFVSDFFLDDFVGGAALNDHELCAILEQKCHVVKRFKSKDVTLATVSDFKNAKWLVSNFFHLKEEVKTEIMNGASYSIICHDYKFVAHTNPAVYKDFIVPDAEKINVEFFAKAKSVFCQSELQKDIYQRNLSITPVNLYGNLWSEKMLDFMGKLKKRPKRNAFCVVKSPYPQKGVAESIAYLISKKLDYDLVSDKDPIAFLNKMAEFGGLCFFARTPETLSRVVCEAKGCGMVVFANELVGACHEPWFKEKDILPELRNMRQRIPALVEASL